MASGSRSLDTDILQVRKVYARTPQNDFIPSSHILISNGDGSTRWNSVSSIVLLSSFGVVYGNSRTNPLLADLSFNILQISTTGVGNTFDSYVDPVTKVLMLSNGIPPFVVANGSVPSVTSAAAATVPNPEYLIPVTGQSSIKYIGVGDIKLSTITAQNAVFVSISTFTSAGYSTISGETFAWRPTIVSSLSTTAGLASFISSHRYVVPASTRQIPMSTVLSQAVPSNDLYFSSFTFPVNNLMRYLDTRTNSTRMFVELEPNFFFPQLNPVSGGAQNVVKEISSYIELNTPASGRVHYQESFTTKYITSQNVTTGSSNYFNTNFRMELNPYDVAANVAQNLPLSTNVTVYHRIVNGLSNATNNGFLGPNVLYDNYQSGALYVQIMNNVQVP